MSFFAARSERDGLAGVALAFALIKPPYVLPLLLVFLVRRRWRALGAFTVTALALLALPTLFFGFSTDGAYVHTLLQAAGGHQAFSYLGASSNDSFAGFTELLLPKSVSVVVSAVLSLIALGFLVRCAQRARSIELPAGLAMVVALLVSPHVFFYDLSILLAPAAMALRHRRDFSFLRSVFVSGYVLLPIGFVAAMLTPMNLAVIAMAGFALWLYLAGMKRESGASATGELEPSWSRRSPLLRAESET
jgi:hypothetical protein